MNFEQRGIALIPDDFTVDWIAWMAQGGLNALKLHLFPGRGDAAAFLESVEARDIPRRASSAGIDLEYLIHSFSIMVPRRLFQKDPDLFRMDARGMRRPEGNLCPSNDRSQELLSRAFVNLSGLLRPTNACFHFWPDDVAAWCHCPGCAALSDADQNVLAMNVLIRALRRTVPDARLACLAYLNTLSVASRIKPDPGLFLEWAPIGRCYRHSIDDPACAINREHAEGLRRLLEVYDPSDAQILEYWMDASMFSGHRKPSVKLPFTREIVRRDVGYYRSLGVRSISSFGVFLDAEYVSRYGSPPVQEYCELLGSGLAF